VGGVEGGQGCRIASGEIERQGCQGKTAPGRSSNWKLAVARGGVQCGWTAMLGLPPTAPNPVQPNYQRDAEQAAN
jgi:hypothetical protein